VLLQNEPPNRHQREQDTNASTLPFAKGGGVLIAEGERSAVPDKIVHGCPFFRPLLWTSKEMAKKDFWTSAWTSQRLFSPWQSGTDWYSTSKEIAKDDLRTNKEDLPTVEHKKQKSKRRK